MRIGTGYDVHRLEAGRELILGGVNVPYELGLAGHSDADVLIHAIIDAILGAACLGDIGSNFPDTDEQYRGISSLLLLKAVKEKINQADFKIENTDATIIAQKPKLAQYIPAMRLAIAEALELDADRVSVKATTTEGLGFEGRGEGISAQAICLLKGIDEK